MKTLLSARSAGKKGEVSSAFSLLELMIGVSIIAVLMLISVPIYGNLKKRGEGSICANNLRQIAAATVSFSSDHNGDLPPYNRQGKYWYLFLMYHNLVGGQFGEGPLPNLNPENRKEKKTVYQCPANPGRIWKWLSPNYAYNRALGDSKIGAVESAGQVIMFVDGGYRNGGPESFYSPYDPASGSDKVACYITDYEGASFFWQRSLNFDVHDGRVNIIFVDGHMEALTKAQVEKRGADLSLLWSRGNQPINNDLSPYFWSSSFTRSVAGKP